MEIKSRKPNRLKEYDYSKNGAYFITICTQNRVEMFWDVENHKFKNTETTVGVGVPDDPQNVSNCEIRTLNYQNMEMLSIKLLYK